MSKWVKVPAGSVALQRKDAVTLEPGIEYRTMGVRWYGKGAYDRGIGTTETIKAKRLFRAHAGDFVFNRIDTQKGAFDVVPNSLGGALATNEFPLYITDSERILEGFLLLYFQQASVLTQIDAMRAGSEGRSRWKEADFEAWRIPLPSLVEQRAIVDVISAVDAQIEALVQESKRLDLLRVRLLDRVLKRNDDGEKTLLGDLIHLEYGKALRADARIPGQVPVFGAAGPAGWHNLANVDGNSPIIIGRKGVDARPRRCPIRKEYDGALRGWGGAGAVRWCSVPHWVIDTAFIVKNISRTLDDRALYWLLVAANLPAVTTKTTLPGLSRSVAYGLSVKVPKDPAWYEELEVTSAAAAANEADTTRLREVRKGLVDALLNQKIEIPGSYDAFLEGAS